MKEQETGNRKQEAASSAELNWIRHGVKNNKTSSSRNATDRNPDRLALTRTLKTSVRPSIQTKMIKKKNLVLLVLLVETKRYFLIVSWF